MSTPRTWTLSWAVEAGWVAGGQIEVGIVAFPDYSFELFYSDQMQRALREE
jgi:hypothetical protein